MFREVMIVGIGTFLTVNLYADFATDFQSAVQLYNEQKNVEAQEAFAKLAGVAPTPKSKAESMSYAASSLSRLKKYDKAMELANKIEIKPISMNCRLDIMFENRKWKEIVEAFKDEDISTWPDDCIFNGFIKRGKSYRFADDLESASKDMEKAVEIAGTDKRNRVIALNDLGDVYRDLKDDQKALDAYQRASAISGMKGAYAYCNAVINVAGLLGRQGKYDEALAELQKMDLPKSSEVWKFQTLRAYGDLYRIQGKKTEALAKYKEALSNENVNPSLLTDVNKKISALEGK